jgi:hypothetical protein
VRTGHTTPGLKKDLVAKLKKAWKQKQTEEQARLAREAMLGTTATGDTGSGDEDEDEGVSSPSGTGLRPGLLPREKVI